MQTVSMKRAPSASEPHLRRAVVAIAIAIAGFASGASAVDVSVVMSGLDQPRGLAVGPEGGLYVAETGRGGAGPCLVTPRATSCYGATGAVSRLWRGEQTRV